jgi:hypothetical protein
MSQVPGIRDTGLRLDGARLRRALYIRGVTADTVARAAKVSPNTMTRAMAGDPIRQRTLREVVRALVAMPVLDVAHDLVVSETRNAAADGATALEGGSASAPSSDPVEAISRRGRRFKERASSRLPRAYTGASVSLSHALGATWRLRLRQSAHSAKISSQAAGSSG